MFFYFIARVSSVSYEIVITFSLCKKNEFILSSFLIWEKVYRSRMDSTVSWGRARRKYFFFRKTKVYSFCSRSKCDMTHELLSPNEVPPTVSNCRDGLPKSSWIITGGRSEEEPMRFEQPFTSLLNICTSQSNSQRQQLRYRAIKPFADSKIDIAENCIDFIMFGMVLKQWTLKIASKFSHWKLT